VTGTGEKIVRRAYEVLNSSWHHTEETLGERGA
jgi:hypothetical protein